jgi:cyclopropane fatty-acyl-phospholipid synthase-like methyltransferase
MEAYSFVADFCKEKIVLDAGCGEGYGVNFLAGSGAVKVVGIDKSEEAINHTRKKYKLENLEFQVMDVTSMSFTDEKFDLVVSFQVIEHLHNYNDFLKEVKRVLKKDGIAIIGTPNKSLCEKGAIGKFHVKEWRSHEFKEMLENFFTKVECNGVFLKAQSDSNVLRLRNSLARFDIFSIRKLFPSLREKVIVSIEKNVLFEVSKSRDLKEALDIIAVCRKS